MEYQNCTKLNNGFKKAPQKRVERYCDFQRFMALRTHQVFGMHLLQRGYSGKLKFDNTNELLDVFVNVESGKRTLIKDSNALL